MGTRRDPKCQKYPSQDEKAINCSLSETRKKKPPKREPRMGKSCAQGKTKQPSKPRPHSSRAQLPSRAKFKSTWDSTQPSPASCSRVLKRQWQFLGTDRWGIQYHCGLSQDIQSAKMYFQMCFCTMCSTGMSSVPAHAVPNVACPPCRDNLCWLVVY